MAASTGQGRVELFQPSLYSGLPAAQQLFQIDQACSMGLKLGEQGDR